MRRDPIPFLVLNEMMVLARRDDDVRASLSALRDHWRGYLVATCRDAGLSAGAAHDLAERCRHELLGANLDLCLDHANTSLKDGPL